MTHALHIMQKQINRERSSNHLPNSACPYQFLPPSPPLWALYQTFQRSFGKHSMWHAAFAVPGRNVKRASSQKKCSGFHMSRTAKSRRGPDPQPPTLLCKDKQTRERGSERLTEARGGPAEAEEDGGARPERSRDKEPG